MASIDPSATVEDGAVVGDGTRVWSNVQVRHGAGSASNCVFGRNSFVDLDVHVGDNVKVQNNASLYEGVTLEDGVFIGPHVIFTNDKVPRAVNPDGTLKSTDDWVLGQTHVRHGRRARRRHGRRHRGHHRPVGDGRIGRGRHARRARPRACRGQPG